MNAIIRFLHKPFFRSYRTLFGLWLIIALYTYWKNMVHNRVPENTYYIFKYVYVHAIQGLTLYGEYLSQYVDENHYGPFFSLFIAPFAVLPDWLGYLLWQLLIVFALYVAVRLSDFKDKQKKFVLWFCAVEMLNCAFVAQFNGVIAALLIWSFVAVEKERDEWSTFAILLGTFIKLYGIVGLAFFFFSKHKVRYVLSFVVWTIVMFCAPMIISSPEYVVSQYVDWYHSLSIKNHLNIGSWDQNISLLGIVRRWSGGQTYSDLWIIIPGLIAFAAAYFRIDRWKERWFREMVLANVMMFVTLFSTGTESYGHIISMVGVVIWYTATPWRRGKWDIALMVFAFILTSLSPSDLCPAYIRKTYIIPYSLKALPIVLIWLKLTWEMVKKPLSPVLSPSGERES